MNVSEILSKREKVKDHISSKISPEKDEGNEEYKLKLFDVSEDRVEQLVTQMRYRIQEGKGECFYVIGVTDDGGVIGLTDEEYKKSLSILQTVCTKNNYTISLLTEHPVDTDKKMYEFLIRENNPIRYIDIRVACAGNVDSGKSSLLGVLLTGNYDDGRGSSRLHVFNFQHEMRTGRTSSVAQHILGFSKTGDPVNYTDFMGRKKSWTEIVSESSKIITFFDLCGHEKYLKTTIMGLTSQFPDVVFILVGGNMGMSKMTKEHIFLCLSLRIPFVIIVTKIDICKTRPEVLKETVSGIKNFITAPAIARIPHDIKDDNDIVMAVKNIHMLCTVPIFYVSNVSGEGISNVRSFLNLFSKNTKVEKNNNKVEMHLDQVFQVVGVGTVIAGQLVSGTIKNGDKLLIGPNNGKYDKITVRSIHCKRTSVETVSDGCYVCLAVKKPDELSLHRGNVIVSVVDKPVQIWEFEADVVVLKTHSTTIKVGYQPVVHCCSIRQTCRIMSITNKVCGRGNEGESEVLRTGDRATVRFRFAYHSEYIKKGVRLLLCEGQTKLIGKITNVLEQDCV